MKTQPLIKILWREHDIDHVRVWRTDWPSDMFEIVEKQILDDIEQVMPIFSIPVEQDDSL